MKKAKLFIAALLACAVAASTGVLAACGDEEDPNVDNGGNTEQTGGGTEQGGEETETKITDGIFYLDITSSRHMLVKLYEDGTYYAEGAMGDVYRGTYIYHEDVGVEYLDYGDDGNFDSTDSTEIFTSTASVEFLDEDGNASTSIVRQTITAIPEGAAEGYVLPVLTYTTTENYIAYADDALQMCKVGSFGRTLPHDADNDFSSDDEVAVLEYTFMVEASSDKIGGIVTQQMLTLEIYDKKFVDKVSQDIDVEGEISKSGNVYTLTYSDGTATLTVAEDGKSAVWVKGSETINYVIYAEASDDDTKEVSYHFTGSAYSGVIELNAYLYADYTVEIIATRSGSDTSLATGTWATGAGFPTITLDNGTATVSGTSATDVTLTLSIDLSGTGTVSEYTLTIVAEAATLSYQFTGTAFSGVITLNAYLYDDGTIEIIATRSGTDSTVASGTWVAGTYFPTITLDSGTATVSATSATDVTLTLNIDLGTGSAADYALAMVSVDSDDEPAVQYTFTGTAFGGVITLNAYLYDDGTIEIIGTRSGTDSTVASGTWVAGTYFPTITLDSGTATVSATSATDVTLTLNIDLGTGSAADYTLTMVS